MGRVVGSARRRARWASILVMAIVAVLIPGAASSQGASGGESVAIRSVIPASVVAPFAGLEPAAGPAARHTPIGLESLVSSAPAPARHVLFGSWVKPAGSQDRLQAVQAVEAKIGRTYSLFHNYHGWQGPLIGQVERSAFRGGRTLFVSWKAAYEWRDGTSSGHGAGYVRWGDIASGAQDAVIAARADELKRFGKTVYLSFHHEPEDDRDLPGDVRAGTPAQFRAAWRHIWRMFHARKVHNVRFVLVLMGATFSAGRAAMWYPGDRFVDVVAADGYNWFRTTNHTGAPWRSFATIFAPAHRFALHRSKPFWVAETGVQEDPGNPGRKAAWLKAMGTQVARWADLGAVVYFMGGANGWWVDSSPRSLAAYRSLAHARIFRPAATSRG